MNELQKVFEAYTRGRARGLRMALATVVGVEGSAYRRPGARMLITETGETTGNISGGCLERDAAERAASVTESRTARIVEYDTRGDEDIVWGLGLGCNGVVRVLLESLHEGGAGARALEFVGERLRARECGVTATVVAWSVWPPEDMATTPEVGERLLLDGGGNVCGGQFADEALSALVRADAAHALARRLAATHTYETAAGHVEVFYDIIAPPRPLLIFGAEHDALPLVRQAQAIGWRVTVVDTRARLASCERFAEADEVLLCRAEDVAARVALTKETAAVVMTHNYLDDIELLRVLLPSPASYVGILGPRARTSKLLGELGEEQAGLIKLHGPVGIDLGAETPEEIALSIVAEIKAVSDARGGGFLRDRLAPIHEGRAAERAAAIAVARPQASVGGGVSLGACRSS